MKDKFGQFKIDFSGADSPKKEEPLFSQEQLDELYKDEEGSTEKDQLEYYYWIKRFGNRRSLDSQQDILEERSSEQNVPKINIPEINISRSEKENVLEKTKKVIAEMKKGIRSSLIEKSGLNNSSSDQNYFVDFKKVLSIAKSLIFKKDPLGAELMRGLGSYKILGTIEKRINEGDYKKMTKYFSDLEKKGSLAALEITKSPRYFFIKEVLNYIEEEQVA
ncbi:MAG TPA: hypothetical protein PK142_01170 [bacterium]|nr:hypothetical protein [bacterium]